MVGVQVLQFVTFAIFATNRVNCRALMSGDKSKRSLESATKHDHEATTGSAVMASSVPPKVRLGTFQCAY